ncbi:MAG TPA: biotin/lipoyl-containing protein [Candidatus Acidoferrum sp.]|nr:biotin/lipoyl-containing protein [Candidatus Acidoferrum sp.]
MTTRTFVATVNGRSEKVQVTGSDGRYRVTVGERTLEVDARQPMRGLWSLLVDGASHVADVAPGEGGRRVDVDGGTSLVDVEEYARHVIRTQGGTGGGAAGQIIKTPLPGKVTHVAVTVGDHVARGDTVVVIEAMKMENEFKSSAAGTVTEIRVHPGQAVNAGDVLVVLKGVEP